MAVKNPDTASAAKPRRQQTIKVRNRAPSTADVVSAVEVALNSAPASVRAGFVDTVADHDGRGLDESLWGPGPSTQDVRTAALQGLKEAFVGRRELLDTSLSRTEAAELLGVSSQAVLDRLTDGELIGLKDGREWRIPMWQLHAGAPRGFLPAIAELRRVFPGGLVALSRWATTPHADLGDLTPADALAAGRVDQVIAAATAATAAAW
jgi:excisionase family DNA binding protein